MAINEICFFLFSQLISFSTSIATVLHRCTNNSFSFLISSFCAVLPQEGIFVANAHRTNEWIEQKYAHSTIIAFRLFVFRYNLQHWQTIKLSHKWKNACQTWDFEKIIGSCIYLRSNSLQQSWSWQVEMMTGSTSWNTVFL